MLWWELVGAKHKVDFSEREPTCVFQGLCGDLSVVHGFHKWLICNCQEPPCDSWELVSERLIKDLHQRL